MPISYTHHVTINPFSVEIVCHTIKELFTSECFHASKITNSNYTLKHIIQDYDINYMSSFFQDHFLVQSYRCLDNVLMCIYNIQKCQDISLYN